MDLIRRDLSSTFEQDLIDNEKFLARTDKKDFENSFGSGKYQSQVDE